MGPSTDIIHSDIGSPNRAAPLKHSSVKALSKCSCPAVQLCPTATLQLFYQDFGQLLICSVRSFRASALHHLIGMDPSFGSSCMVCLLGWAMGNITSKPWRNAEPKPCCFTLRIHVYRRAKTTHTWAGAVFDKILLLESNHATSVTCFGVFGR